MCIMAKAKRSIRVHDGIHNKFKRLAAQNGTTMTYELEEELKCGK